jgi:hypothetical protein
MSDFMSGTQHRLKRGRSSDMWAPLNVEAMRSNPELGFFQQFDFVDPVNDLAAFTVSTATAGTGTFAAVDSTAGAIGSARMTSTAVTVHHGVNIQLGATTGGLFTPTDNSVICIEMVGLLTASTLPRFFMGLATQNAKPFGATGLLDTAANSTGLVASGGLGTLQSGFRKASGTAVLGTSFHTLVTGRSYKLGMRLTGTNLLEFWMNGLKIPAAAVNSAVMPLAIMAPTFSILSGGTAAPTFDVDLISIGWNYSADLSYATGT